MRPSKRRVPGAKSTPINRAWKEQVRDAMRARHMTTQQLADAVGVHRTAIANMLKPDQRSSVVVDDVCAILDIPLPVPVTEFSQRAAALAQQIESLPEFQRQAVEAMVAAFKKSND